MEVVVKHLHDPLPSIRRLAPGTSQACEELLIRMMAKDPNHRYPSWETCIWDMEAVIKGRMPKTAMARVARQASQRLVVQRQVTGGGAGHGRQAAPFWNDGWVIVAMGGLLALIFGLLAVAVWNQQGRSEIPETPMLPSCQVASTTAVAPPRALTPEITSVNAHS